MRKGEKRLYTHIENPTGIDTFFWMDYNIWPVLYFSLGNASCAIFEESFGYHYILVPLVSSAFVFLSVTCFILVFCLRTSKILSLWVFYILEIFTIFAYMFCYFSHHLSTFYWWKFLFCRTCINWSYLGFGKERSNFSKIWQ